MYRFLKGPVREDSTGILSARPGIAFTVKLGRLDFTGAITGSRMTVDLIVYDGSTRNFTVVKTPT